MLIKKKVLKRLMDIKKLFLLVGAFVLALFSGSVSAVLLGGALDINLQDENSKQQELTTINLNSDELTIPVVPLILHHRCLHSQISPYHCLRHFR